MTGNLIVNGDAEAGVGSTDGTTISAPGWMSTGEATAIVYGSPNGYPAATDPGPPDRGINFFSGGQNDETSSLSQAVDVGKYGASIDGGGIEYKLDGWLGGYIDQNDNATLIVTFQDAKGASLGTASVGPVTAADRNSLTGLLLRSTTGMVPKGTRTVQVLVSMVRTDGTYNDAYADDLSLVFASGGLTAEDAGASPGSDASAAGEDASNGNDAGQIGASILPALQAAASGMQADINGDGTNDYTTTKRPDGSTETIIDLDGDGNPEFDEVVDSAGNRTVTIDSNSDGVADEETTYTVGPPPKQVTLEDVDFNGAMDHRQTVTYDLTAGTVEVVLETSAAQDGNYTVDSDTTEPISAAQATGAGCNGQIGFPSDTGGATTSVAGAHVPSGGGGGRCTDAEASRLGAAYKCAMNQGLHCLLSTNRNLALRLFDALAHDSLLVGCGNPCAGEDAATQRGVWWIPGQTAGHTNFNPNFVDNGSDTDLCAVALHEALHWIGEGFEPNHDDGTDRVYGCGRYCGGCTSRGPGFMSSNIDCAKCAGTQDEKQSCGVQQKMAAAPGQGSGLCHQGLACIAADCADPQGVETDTCDGTAIPGLMVSFSCCASCPDTCNASNDIPCQGMPNLLNTCSQKPPACP
jgi:hypothetical protein